MGVEEQGYIPPRIDDEIRAEGAVINFPSGETQVPPVKPVAEQIKEATHDRIEEGDIEVPPWVTDSKGTKSPFVTDETVEFLANKDHKMDESVNRGWEEITPRATKF